MYDLLSFVLIGLGISMIAVTYYQEKMHVPTCMINEMGGISNVAVPLLGLAALVAACFILKEVNIILVCFLINASLIKLFFLETIKKVARKWAESYWFCSWYFLKDCINLCSLFFYSIKKKNHHLDWYFF